MTTALIGAGGGPKGGYSAGVLKALKERGLLEDVTMGFGNSVNAINIPYLCQEEFSAESLRVLEDLWMDVVDSDVFKPWLIPYIPALWKGGLNSIAPLGKFLEPYIKYEKCLHSRVPSWVSALNLNTGKMEFGSSRGEHFLQWILASAAHPIWFEPVQIGNYWYTDGGVTDVTPVKQAIKNGATDLLVLLHTVAEEDPAGLISRTFREFNLAMEARLEDDLKVVEWINRGVLAGAEGFEDKRYISMRVFRPRKPLHVEMPHFRPKDSKRIFNQGYAETKAATIGVFEAEKASLLDTL
jgi:NTE family protein